MCSPIRQSTVPVQGLDTQNHRVAETSLLPVTISACKHRSAQSDCDERTAKCEVANSRRSDKVKRKGTISTQRLENLAALFEIVDR